MANRKDLPDITDLRYQPIWMAAVRLAGQRLQRTPTSQEIVDVYAQLLTLFTYPDGSIDFEAHRVRPPHNPAFRKLWDRATLVAQAAGEYPAEKYIRPRFNALVKRLLDGRGGVFTDGAVGQFPGWRDLTVGEYTIKHIPESEFWSVTPGDFSLETIMLQTIKIGANLEPKMVRVLMAGWLLDGVWYIGLYRGEKLIGAFDIGLLTEGQGLGKIHVNYWYAIRPDYRKTVPGEILAEMIGTFIERLRAQGARRMRAIHNLASEEGRAWSKRVEKFGYRTVWVRGQRELKEKLLSVTAGTKWSART
jgi:hypothetical protein